MQEPDCDLAKQRKQLVQELCMEKQGGMATTIVHRGSQDSRRAIEKECHIALHFIGEFHYLLFPFHSYFIQKS